MYKSKYQGVQPKTEQIQSARQVVDPKAEAWRQRNTWFGADEEMTALALGLHEKLVRSGVDPRSEDYYQRVDATMRKRFPEYFEEEEPQTSQTQSGSTRQTEPETKDSETKSPRKSANVAPVTRSTAPRQIRLTTTQVALAKKLGLTNEAYAKELMKLENR